MHLQLLGSCLLAGGLLLLLHGRQHSLKRAVGIAVAAGCRAGSALESLRLRRRCRSRLERACATRNAALIALRNGLQAISQSAIRAQPFQSHI